jgi:hypothetical protein
MGETSTTLFTEAARVLANAAHESGVIVPGFRTPPRIVGRDRTIRRSTTGEGGVVAVRLRGRPFTAVIADMIEGVIVLNRLTPPQSDQLRGDLWRVMLQFTTTAFTRPAFSPVSSMNVHESPISRVA